MSERRTEDRHAILLRVDYEGDTEFLHDYTENLSKGGVFVATARDFVVGDEVRLVLSFPGLLTPFKAVGTVRWLRDPDGEGGRRGIGVQMPDEPEALKRLTTLADRVRARDPLVVEELSTYRVLVVEDNEHVRLLLREGLRAVAERRREEKIAFQIDESGSGQDGLARVRERAYDLLVADLYLPGMDGMTLIRNVRADERLKSLPILAISAGGADALDAAKKAGADMALAKPLLVRSFFETVVTLLRARETASD